VSDLENFLAYISKVSKEPSLQYDMTQIDGKLLKDLVDAYNDRQALVNKIKKCTPRHFGSHEEWIIYFKGEAEKL
jgi:hypothetical protein